MMINNIIKIALSGILLSCLMDMPYGYYQLVRFIAMIAFAFLSYSSYQEGNSSFLFIVYGGLALLFQPILKITLGREIWNIIDVIVAIGLVCSIFFSKRMNDDAR